MLKTLVLQQKSQSFPQVSITGNIHYFMHIRGKKTGYFVLCRQVNYALKKVFFSEKVDKFVRDPLF